LVHLTVTERTEDRKEARVAPQLHEMDLEGDSKTAREVVASHFVESLVCAEEHKMVVALIAYRFGLLR
jgi:hypothetical protein